MTRIAPAAVALAMSAVVIATPATQASTTHPHISARTRLSGGVPLQPGCSPGNGNGPHAAVDPSNADHVAVVYSLGENVAGVVATTSDGGTSWSRAPLTETSACTGSTAPANHIGDPMIAIGTGGRVGATESSILWTSALGVDHDAVRLEYSRSDNGGTTFQPPVEPEPGVADARGPVSFDPGSNDGLLAAFERVHYLNSPDLPASLGNPSTYLFGVGGSIGVAHTGDGGASWAPAVTAASALPGEELATIALLRSGASVVLIGASVDDTQLVPFLLHRASSYQESLFAVRSVNGGTSWSSPTLIPAGTFTRQSDSMAATPGCCIPDAAVGPDGRVYVTWPNITDDTVALAQSADQGATWTVGRNALSAGGVAQPAVAARGDGSIGVFFYDLSTGSDSHTHATPKLATSSDAGQTWNVLSLASAFDVDAIVASACPDGQSFCDGTPMGPYQDLVALPTGFGVTLTLGAPASTSRGAEDVWWYRIGM